MRDKLQNLQRYWIKIRMKKDPCGYIIHEFRSFLALSIYALWSFFTILIIQSIKFLGVRNVKRRLGTIPFSSYNTFFLRKWDQAVPKVAISHDLAAEES